MKIKIILGKMPFFRKMPTFLWNFGPFSCEKILYPRSLDHHPCLSTANSAANNYGGWWELGCFHKTSAYWKILAVIPCVKIQRGESNNNKYLIAWTDEELSLGYPFPIVRTFVVYAYKVCQVQSLKYCAVKLGPFDFEIISFDVSREVA